MNSLKLNADQNELYALNNFIGKIIQKKDAKIELIIEEVFINIVNYSNSDFIIVNADFKDSLLTIEFIDNGIQFNPLLNENPDMPENIDGAPIGGLGIFLTKKMSDKLYYHYINGENHLKIIKKVE